MDIVSRFSDLLYRGEAACNAIHRAPAVASGPTVLYAVSVHTLWPPSTAAISARFPFQRMEVLLSGIRIKDAMMLVHPKPGFIYSVAIPRVMTADWVHSSLRTPHQSLCTSFPMTETFLYHLHPDVNHSFPAFFMGKVD